MKTSAFSTTWDDFQYANFTDALVRAFETPQASHDNSGDIF